MKNKIYYVSAQEMKKIQEILKKDNTLFVAEIDGNKIPLIRDYLNIISKLLNFPMPSENLDSYQDWMRDLDWLNKDGYVLIIRNFKFFLNRDLKYKEIVLNSFRVRILPWWEGEVEKYEVGGKPKPFNLYLVD